MSKELPKSAHRCRLSSVSLIRDDFAFKRRNKKASKYAKNRSRSKTMSNVVFARFKIVRLSLSKVKLFCYVERTKSS